MLATPVPSPAETRDNQTFSALLWALSRPGLMRNLPQAGEDVIVSALLDRECRAYSADPLLIPQIMRSGAELADIERADHVFLGAMTGPDLLARVPVGSDLYPDDGATVIARVTFGTGPELRLTGPGVDGAVTVQVDGLPGGFWESRASRLRYPVGFDLFLIDSARVIGVPRSTKVEVL